MELGIGDWAKFLIPNFQFNLSFQTPNYKHFKKKYIFIQNLIFFSLFMKFLRYLILYNG